MIKGKIKRVICTFLSVMMIGMQLEPVMVTASVENGRETTLDLGFSDWNGTRTEAIFPIQNTYIVENAAQLAWLAQETKQGNTFIGKKVLLAADIDLAGKEWVPIGDSKYAFEGSFDGQNHTIYNLTVSGSKYDRPGLFGVIRSKLPETDVVIENVCMENVTITDAPWAGGGLIAYMEVNDNTRAVVQNCSVTGTVHGSVIGGAIGIISGGYQQSDVLIQEIDAVCDMETGNRGGGIVGLVQQKGSEWSSIKDKAGTVTIKDCNYKGTMKGTGR